MSVSTRKKPVWSIGGRQQAGAAASRTTPFAHQAQQAQQAAQQAMPFARNAASGAIARTTPAVDAARSWAAPQLEQSARAISDTLAPMISSALISAARKIDAPDRNGAAASRRRGRIAGAMLATAAAGAATAIALRLRRQPDGFSAAVATDADEFGPVTYIEEEIIEPEPGTRYEGGEGDVNGHRIV